MFKRSKRTVAAVLAAMIAMSSLAGCADNGEAKTSSAVSQVSSATAASVGSEGEYEYSAGLTENGYFEGVTAADYVKLPDYKNMEVPAETATVTDEELQSEIDSILSSYASSAEVTDREVKDGDTVNIDYVGSVDGVEFAGGNTGGSGTTVTIGVTSYIDDFLEQLIGHKPGDTFDVNVTFPDPYENDESLSGKDAVFVTTINYIVEDTTPEFTDEFVTEQWKETDGWTTVEQAREGIREELRISAVINYIWSEADTNAEVSEVPEAIINYHVDNMKNYYELVADQYSMEIEDFLTQYLGASTMDEVVENNKAQTEQNARSSLILQALCEDMDIVVTDEDISSYFERNAGTADFSEFEEIYGKAYLILLTREDLVKQKLGEGR